MSLRPLRTENMMPTGGVHISDFRDVRMNWSTIFSGACLTLGFGLFFLLLGNAIGLNVANTVRTDIGGTLKFFSWLYMAVTFIASYFIGSYLCTRTEGVNTRASSVAHGLTIWGLSSFAFLAVATISSIGFRILLAGLASNAANWLVLCVVGIGAVAAAVGSMVGKSSTHALGSTPSAEVTDRRVA